MPERRPPVGDPPLLGPLVARYRQAIDAGVTAIRDHADMEWAAAVLMWGAYVIGGEAGGVWSERSITAFLAACLLTVVPAALVPACAARQFRRLDIESSFPAAER